MEPEWSAIYMRPMCFFVGAVCVLGYFYKWLKPEALNNCSLLHVPVSRLTHAAASESAEFDTASVQNRHTNTLRSLSALTPTSKMNEMNINLKVKLKMAAITPLHPPPTNTLWLFLSVGVRPFCLTLLEQTVLRVPATVTLCSSQTSFCPKIHKKKSMTKMPKSSSFGKSHVPNADLAATLLTGSALVHLLMFYSSFCWGLFALFVPLSSSAEFFCRAGFPLLYANSNLGEQCHLTVLVL